MIRVVVADDHAIVRAGLRALLSTEPQIQLVAEAADGSAAVDAVARYAPNVLLIDLSMPGLNGVEATTRARAQSPATRVLVLSMHSSPEYVRPAVRAGARGYVVKGAGLEDLIPAIKQVAAGELFFTPTVAQAAAQALNNEGDADELSRLTPREREVLQLVAEGHTNRGIAQRLSLSAKTVDSHRTSLMRKLDLHDAQALTRLAVRRGLVSRD